MTREIFKQWLIKLDHKFELSSRKVLLIVDHCSAHTADVDLKAITLVFLPPNTTAALQPVDQGVIKNIIVLQAPDVGALGFVRWYGHCDAPHGLTYAGACLGSGHGSNNC